MNNGQTTPDKTPVYTVTNTDLGLQWKPLSEPVESKRINIKGASKMLSDPQLNFNCFFLNLHESIILPSFNDILLGICE